MARDHGVKRQSGIDARNLARLNPILGLNRVPSSMVGWRKVVTIDKYDTVEITCKSNANVVPHGIDADVMVGLTTAFMLQGAPQNATIKLSMAELCACAGMEEGGKTYKNIQDSLQRLRDAKFITRSWWRDDSKSNKAVEMDFSIIDSIKSITDFGNSELEQQELFNRRFTAKTLFEIRINPDLAETVRADHTRYIDLDWYARLPQPLARLLYRSLEEIRVNSTAQDIVLPVTTMGEHLGLREVAEGTFAPGVPETRVLPPRKVRRALEPAHKVLLDSGYLKSVTYIGTGASQSIQYAFQPDADISRPVDLQLVSLLTNRGVTLGIARNLVLKHTRDEISVAVQRFDDRLKRNFKPISRGGFMVDILRNPQKYEEVPTEAPRPALTSTTPPVRSRKAQEAPAEDDAGPSRPREARQAEMMLGRALTKTPAERAIRDQLIVAFLAGHGQLTDMTAIKHTSGETAEVVAANLLIQWGVN